MAPPAFPIGVTGGAAQPVQRIAVGTGFNGIIVIALFFVIKRELMTDGQVHKAHGDILLKTIAQRLPFRGERRKGVKRGVM